MCVRFRMLQNIHQLPIGECLDYIKRLVKFYLFFSILYLVLLIIDGGSGNAFQFALAILYIIGLLAQSVGSYILSEEPSHHNVLIALCVFFLMLVYNFIVLVSLLVKQDFLAGGLSVLSIMVTGSSIYILYHIREKILSRDRATLQALDVEANNIDATPTHTSAEYVPSVPVATAYAVPVLMNPMLRKP